MDSISPAIRISLGHRPRGCRYVRILGVRTHLEDYDRDERRAIMEAGRILYPSRYWAQPLHDAGKALFPGPRHYYYHADKIRQTVLFSLKNIPYPRTRVFYGRQTASVKDFFSFPFVAKVPRASGQGRGIRLIDNAESWEAFTARNRVVLVQEYLHLEKDLRVVVMAGRVMIAYWRIACKGEFRTNIYQGGRVDFTGLPDEGVAFAHRVAVECGFDDVGLDLCFHAGRWMILEANMNYGLHGLSQAGCTLAGFLDGLIEEGVI